MGENIILGITGGIAAYKMASLASKLTKKEYSVYTVMTESAQEFISPLTFQSITGNPVETDLFSPPEHFDIKHISLAQKADLVLISPATANMIGKMASGIADDLLSTLVLATEAPILVAPAMNTRMYNKKVVRDNIKYLKNELDIKIIEPGRGHLACGDEGKGRMPEPDVLFEYIEKESTENSLEKKKILISAGPTREPLDPVRFLSNYSSGKMGYALARESYFRGADVTLVSGPVNLDPISGLKKIEVKTAREMYAQIIEIAPQMDIIIMTAAVADFYPQQQSAEKIKKNKSKELELKLASNPDILKELGQQKNNDQILVGFAAESSDIKNEARRKLSDKNLDLIVANNIKKSEIGFGSDENEVYIINSKQEKYIPRKSKQEIAQLIVEEIIKMNNKI